MSEKYKIECYDCDFYRRGGDAKDTFRELCEHITVTGHVGQHSYAGVWGPTDDGDSCRELAEGEY